ncbi:dihydrofolate reductase family protein [Kitasatospora sp. NPDC058201]|uniref:dihydrofolate reductase family protein n=1 Tax=unclassified Kitasatospora TaxID=2633591 RepID=UPI003651C210
MGVSAPRALGFWPTVLDTEGADPRDVGFARWLVDTEKVVLSSTLREAPWERTTIVDGPTAEVVADLRSAEGGDIRVLSGASVIKALPAADLVDRLALTVCPVFLGGGPRLFDDGLPTGRWTLASQAAGEHGTVAVVYDRAR